MHSSYSRPLLISYSSSLVEVPTRQLYISVSYQRRIFPIDTENFTPSILEKSCFTTLAHFKYTKSQKGNKTGRKDAKRVCNLFICDMIRPSFIPSPKIHQLRDLIRYKLHA